MAKYFTLEELSHSDYAAAHGIDNEPDEVQQTNLVNLMTEVLDKLRSEWGSPIRVTSGYRCPELNAALGGAKNSQHLVGEAADIQPVDGSVDDLYIALQNMWDDGDIEVDQAIRESADGGREWIHVSWRTGDMRNEFFRMINGKVTETY